MTATFLSRNWLLPHFLYYDKRVGNSKIPGDQAGQWKPGQCRPSQCRPGQCEMGQQPEFRETAGGRRAWVLGLSSGSKSELTFLLKVKRFLCTLIQFGTEISAETGEKVKELVFNLVVSHKLQLYFDYFMYGSDVSRFISPSSLR